MGFDLGSIAGAAISGGLGIAGGMMNATASKTIAREQMKQQKEFAQNGIQWRVEDAKKAGLHPLYAIGAQGATYTPVSQDSSSMGNAVADAGAYLGKAVDGAIDTATRRELELENLEYARMQRELAMKKSGAELMNAELVNRNLVLRNEEQEFLNARLASGTSSNPVRPVASGLAGASGIYDIGGAYSNNPAVRSHLGKVRRNSASADAGAPLSGAFRASRGVTPVVEKEGTFFENTDGSLTYRPSEPRSQSTQDMSVFGVNFPTVGWYANQIGRQISGFGNFVWGNPPDKKLINGQIYRYSWVNDNWYPTGQFVR